MNILDAAHEILIESGEPLHNLKNTRRN